MVRIDHLLVEQYLPLSEQLRSLLIEQPSLVESSSEEVAEPIAYVARSRLQPQQYLIPHRTLDRPTIIVSCGLLNFETSAYANGSSLEFQDNFYEYRKGCGATKFLREVEHSHFEKYPTDAKIFLESFKANYPTLCRDRNIIVIDNTRFKNPGLDYSLRGHLGIHPETLRGIVESEHFEVTNAPLRRLRSDMQNLVINVCRSGRHRTVGNAEAQRDPIQDILYGPCGPWEEDRSGPKVEVFHLQAETDWNTYAIQTALLAI